MAPATRAAAFFTIRTFTLSKRSLYGLDKCPELRRRIGSLPGGKCCKLAGSMSTAATPCRP